MFSFWCREHGTGGKTVLMHSFSLVYLSILGHVSQARLLHDARICTVSGDEMRANVGLSPLDRKCSRERCRRS